MAGNGIFNDGRSAARIEADLRAVGRGLEIRDPRDNLMLALWAYADLAPVKPLKPGVRLKKLRLTCATDPEARLVVDDPALITALQKANRNLRPPRKPLPLWLRGAIAGGGAILVLLVLVHCLTLAAAPLARVLPLAWEEAIGRILERRVARQFGGACAAPAGRSALAEMASRLNDDSGLPFAIALSVVRDPSVNAYALPSGHVVLTSGLVEGAESADQVAAVAALEVAHSALHQASQRSLGHPTLLAAIMAGLPAGLTEDALAHLLGAPHDRQNEAEALAFALALLEKADIADQSMGNFFRLQDLRQRQQGTPSAFLVTHPVLVKRGEASPFQPFARPVLTDKEWLALRTICN